MPYVGTLPPGTPWPIPVRPTMIITGVFAPLAIRKYKATTTR